MDSIHSDRTIYKRYDFKTPIERVLKIHNWFCEHSCKMAGWETRRGLCPRANGELCRIWVGCFWSQIVWKSCTTLAALTSESWVWLSKKWPQSAGYCIGCSRNMDPTWKELKYLSSYWEWYFWIKIQHNQLIYFLFMWRHKKEQELANLLKRAWHQWPYLRAVVLNVAAH